MVGVEVLALVAAGEDAGAVAESQGAALGPGGEAPGAAEVEDLAVDVGEGERDLPGAGEAFGGTGLEGSAACDSAARKRSRGNVFGE